MLIDESNLGPVAARAKKILAPQKGKKMRHKGDQTEKNGIASRRTRKGKRADRGPEKLRLRRGGLGKEGAKKGGG